MLPEPVRTLPEPVLLQKIEVFKDHIFVCYSYNVGPDAVRFPRAILSTADREKALTRIEVIVFDKDSGKPIVIPDKDLYWSYPIAYCRAEQILNAWNEYQKG